MGEIVRDDPAGAGTSLGYVGEDLVVDLQHQRLIEAELAERQIRYEADDVEPSAALGLTLLSNLQGLPAAAQRIRLFHAQEIAALEGFTGRRFEDLDLLLFDLRRHLAEKFGGWFPELGKNRDVEGVQPFSTGISKIHDVGAPESTLALSIPETGAGHGIRVGILDTQVYPHPVLVGHLVDDGVLMTPAEIEAHDAIWRAWEGHATFVASMVLTQAPSARLDMRPLRGLGDGNITVWEMAKAMVSFDRSTPIVNLSFGCRTLDGQPPLVLDKAVDRLNRTALIVASAGNHGKSELATVPIWPAALPDVVAVGANREEGSDFSPDLPWVSCTADGVDVHGAYLDKTVTWEARDADEPGGAGTTQVVQKQFHGAAVWSGTSFAAGTVSGAVAARMAGHKSARQALSEMLDGTSPHPAVKTVLAKQTDE